MKQENKITYESPIHVEVGDVFYRIESGDCATFREPCKVCGDTHKVTVNGITFDCPVCRSGCNNPEIITVYNYVVYKYRLSEITHGMLTNNNWKDDGCRQTTFHFYHKDGLGYSGNYYGFDKDEWDLNHSLNIDYKDKPDNDNIRYYANILYSDYKLVCEIVARLNAKEMQKLADYNRDYGSNYIFEPKQKNDTKN